MSKGAYFYGIQASIPSTPWRISTASDSSRTKFQKVILANRVGFNAILYIYIDTFFWEERSGKKARPLYPQLLLSQQTHCFYIKIQVMRLLNNSI
jgi:hypothetical protein